MNTKTQPSAKPSEKTNLISSGKAASLLSVAPETLRRYERQGLISSEKTSGGHRRFRESELELLKGQLASKTTKEKIASFKDQANKQQLKMQKKKLREFLGQEVDDNSMMTVRDLTKEYSEIANWLLCPLTTEDPLVQLQAFLLVDDQDFKVYLHPYTNDIMYREFTLSGGGVSVQYFKFELGKLQEIQENSLELFQNNIREYAGKGDGTKTLLSSWWRGEYFLPLFLTGWVLLICLGYIIENSIDGKWFAVAGLGLGVVFLLVLLSFLHYQFLNHYRPLRRVNQDNKLSILNLDDEKVN